MKKIYFGGDIITMKNEEDRPEAVIVENGKIIYVGNLSEAETLCGMQAERIHLKGKTLMPAFIDSHSHFSQVAQNILMCDLSGAKSFEDIYRMLKAYMEKNEIGEKEVVFGVGYDHNFLAEETHPDITLLDRVSKETPIYISHVSGHMGVANSAMLWLAKVNADAPDPDGGRFGRTEDGSLNGYVEEIPALMPIIMAAMPRIKTDMERQMQLAQETYLKHGITTIQEGAAMGAGVTELVKYASSGKLKLDIVVYIMENEYKQDIAALEKYNKKYENGLKIGGAKIILDGSPQGKSAWMSRPYEGESEYRGYPSHDDAYVEKAAFHAVKGGYQLLAHCNGDAASEQFLNAYEKALRETENPDMDLRPVMIHCQTVREDQLDRMKDIGMIPSIFVGHTYYWGDVHLKNLGGGASRQYQPGKVCTGAGTDV